MSNYDEEYDEVDVEEAPKKKKFNIFDWYYRDGKGVEGDDINALKEPTVKNGFKLAFRKLGKLMSANLLFVFGNFPIFFIILAMSGILSESSSAPLNPQWGVLKGAMLFDQSAELSSYLNMLGGKVSVNVINTPTIVFFCLGILLLFTMGFTKVGTSYIYRNIVLGEPIFPFSDFFYIIKRNWKQALIFGIIDTIFIAMFAYNIYFLFINYSASAMNPLMLLFTIVMAIIYLIARQYAYLMIFTFDLKLTKIIKNSLYFVMLGIKRNLACVGFTLLLLILSAGLFIIYMPIGLILPFVITIALIDFIGVYCAYPNIDKYMVDHSKSTETEDVTVE